MRKLLSLPPNLVGAFHEVTGHSREAYFCTSDPVGCKLGSGGGTAWLLEACRRDEGAAAGGLSAWLAREKRILLHAGGQSRRLPSYAASGKVLAPVPVFRWARGQKIDQNLLDLQVPFYERILGQAPDSIHTLIASGDICLRAAGPLPAVPEVDIVCYGLWASPEQASHHGMFLMRRESPAELDFMLQKPSVERQAELMPTHLALMDIGVWLLSDRAVECLCRKCVAADGTIRSYDLYGDFGCALGARPSRPDAEVGGLSVAVLPLTGGEFYHFGTSPELISSAAALQNVVKDQRFILQKEVRRQSVFTQNCRMANRCGERHSDIWVENADLGPGWTLTCRNIVTGVPANDWTVTLAPGVCLDMAPVGEKDFALRPYGYEDPSRGDLHDSSTRYLGQDVTGWLAARGLVAEDLGRTDDIQAASLFPVSDDLALLGRLLEWMTSATPDPALRECYLALPRLSADRISDTCSLPRLTAARRALQRANLRTLAANWRKSVFYQTDLGDMAAKYAAHGLGLPPELGEGAGLMTRIHDAMFRSEALRATDGAASARYAAEAFGLLREGLAGTALSRTVSPRLTTASDQIVWARSSVRIDVAGGWTDTPPYSLLSGGNVVNLAIEMNGQPPLQVYVKPSREPVVICRSIDLGAMERIETYDELRSYDKVGSPFSIPKAALTLCGFLPGFSTERFPSLRSQLEAFGSGIEITLLAAIPAGSGLGTSSILASTVLGALNNFCGLGWDKHEICNRTLVLEQLLTTGGGWQDQYGGVFEGVKLLQTGAGFDQAASVRWLPERLFRDADLRPCHLLYYTGITRTAKDILAEIVRGMFLNSGAHLSLLDEMKEHALAMFDALQTGDLARYGALLRTTWAQNKALDAGTSPAAVEALGRRIDDLCYGYKLPGAGGGGFMYMVAKDAEAARRIVSDLTASPLTPTARFVDMALSSTGLQVSRS